MVLVAEAAVVVLVVSFLDADVPVTGGSGVAVNVGAGGEGHFVPNHPSYPNPVGSAPFRPVEW